MIVLADTVSEFLKKNRMYEVLGLFILFLVGIMLISEGGHLAHLKLFGLEVVLLAKSTFYPVIFILGGGRYRPDPLSQQTASAVRHELGPEILAEREQSETAHG